MQRLAVADAAMLIIAQLAKHCNSVLNIMKHLYNIVKHIKQCEPLVKHHETLIKHCETL